MRPGRIPIGDAKRVSEERGCPMVVIFGIAEDREQFCITTYGATKSLCRQAAGMANQLAEALYGEEVSPLHVAPDSPDAPAQYESR